MAQDPYVDCHRMPRRTDEQHSQKSRPDNETPRALAQALITLYVELDDLYNRGEHLRSRIAAVLADSALPMCVTGMGSLMTIPR